MEKSESIKNIAPAFAKMQGELKDLFKGAKGYGYKYATLDSVLKEIREKNEKHGLSFLQDVSVEGEEIIVETTLLHTSGEWFQFKSSLPFARLKGMNDYQSAGSGFTYARRYVLSAIFGIASDEDTDAQGEQANKQQKSYPSQIQNKPTRPKYIKTKKPQQNQIPPQIQQPTKQLPTPPQPAQKNTTKQNETPQTQPLTKQPRQQNPFRKEVLTLADTNKRKEIVKELLDKLSYKKLEELKENEKPLFLRELKIRLKKEVK